MIYVHLSRRSAHRRHRYRPRRKRRPRNAGPTTHPARERCTISLKPVIDLPAGHIPVDCYEIPASLREQLLLRYPADVFPYAAAVSRASTSTTPSPISAPTAADRPAKPESATSDPTYAATTTENPRRLASPTTRTRHLAVAITPRSHLPRQRHRHPPPRRHPIRADNLARRRQPIARPRQLTDLDCGSSQL